MDQRQTGTFPQIDLAVCTDCRVLGCLIDPHEVCLTHECIEKLPIGLNAITLLAELIHA